MKTFKEYFLNESASWIGVDLDGTLAHHDQYHKGHIGKPIPAMLERVKKWVANGQKVKIFTARADDEEEVNAIKAWLKEQGLPDLEVTNLKDKFMTELWDDRAIQVVRNQGTPVGEEDVTEASHPWLSALAAGLIGASSAHAKPQPRHFDIEHRKPVIQQVKPKPAISFDQLIQAILKHEGLQKGQTPFRMTNPTMRHWTKIHGYKIDNATPKTPATKKFLYLIKPEEVPLAVMKQFEKYASNPSKYGMSANVSLGEALKKFDQSNVKGKMAFLKSKFPDIDFNLPLTDYMQSPKTMLAKR